MQTSEEAKTQIIEVKQGLDRSAWDRIVSAAGAVVAVVFITVGAFAVYGGNFGRANVQDRLAPQKIAFPPAEAMSPEELAAVGAYAGPRRSPATSAGTCRA
jgi:Mn2+/Fe2+ NRAMP family transporter